MRQERDDDRARGPSLNGRITQLDGLRAIAIIAVFWHHAFETKLAWMGVDLFFILSGFLITDILIRSCHRRILAYLGSFYGRRIRRILPPYFLLLAITCVLFGAWWLKSWYYYLGFMNLLPITHVKFPDSLAILWFSHHCFAGFVRLCFLTTFRSIRKHHSVWTYSPLALWYRSCGVNEER